LMAFSVNRSNMGGACCVYSQLIRVGLGSVV
jgi:hypothetical protein